MELLIPELGLTSPDDHTFQHAVKGMIQMRRKLILTFKKSQLLLTPSIIIPFLILAVFVTGAIFAPFLATHDPNKLDLANALLMPSRDHLLGTDNEGRDIFSRLLFGFRPTLLGAIGVVGLASIAGIFLGMVCGYFEGLIDTIVMRLWDINLAFPTLLLAFIFVACFGKSLMNVVFALGIIFMPLITRLTRSLVLTEKNKTYVEAARSLGYSHLRILFVHIFPNCIQTILVQVAISLANAILDLSALSFLGLGVQPPTADWAVMLQEGKAIFLSNPVVVLAPGTAIVLVIVSINILSDGFNTY